MKEGWEYKKFDEVFDLQMGKTPSRDNPLYWGGKNIWVSIADLQGKYIGSSKECISDSAVSESGIKVVHKDTVIMSFKLSVGRSAITTTDLYTNEAIMSFSPKPEYKIIPDYIYYYLKGYKWVGANKAVMGMTLNKKSISSNTFAIPEYIVQQQIVSELDLLSGAMEKQKAQLEELDKLAQSIFYDMFGDPVIDKVFEISLLGDLVGDLKYGTGTPPTFSPNGYKFIRATNIKKGGIVEDNLVYIDEIEASKLEKCKLTNKDLIIVRSGVNAGDVCRIGDEYAGQYAGYDIIITVDLKIIDTIYLNSVLNNRSYIDHVIKPMTRRAAQPHLNAQQVKSMPIPLPPIALQQEFASKVEAIESMKAKVRQSLSETETLFNSRMDYYFN